MTGNEILKADMLDILFDNRNKDYGAYRLRKFYNNRLILSLGLSLGSVLFLFLFFGSANSKSITTKNKPVVELKDVQIAEVKKKIEIPQPKRTVTPTAPTPPQRVFTNRLDIVREDKIIDRKMVSQTDLTNVVSDVDFKGMP